jgi:hypothetical protein
MMRVQTVRSTGKGWGAMQAAGFLAMLSSAVLPSLAGTGADIRTTAAIGVAIGLIVWASGWAGAWRDRG